MRRTLLCALTAVALPALAAAEDWPCKADRQKLCPDAGPDSLRACFAAHKDQLSEQCKSAVGDKLSELGGGGDRGEARCRQKMQRLCPDMQPGDGRFMDCVKAHKSGLDKECSEILSRKLAGGGGDMGPCAEDVKKLCAGMTPGDGKFGPCMKEHKDDLSAACLARVTGWLSHGEGGDGGDHGGNVSSACKDDGQKFCAGMHPGDGKFGPCMKEHKDDLSAGCKQAMMGMMMRRKGGMGGGGPEGMGAGRGGMGRGDDDAGGESD